MLASVDTTLLHGLRFRMVGPPRGGRVTTVTGVPTQPRTFYMGVASGGLFRTTDAGASWVGEYGSVSNPDERAFLASISPYNNLQANVQYPEPFIWTTTKDDRVGPQHARKFAAKMAAMGHPYLFYEVVEGGHGAGANLEERAHTSALEYTYFARKLTYSVRSP